LIENVLVGNHSETFQVRQDSTCATGHLSWWVDILDSDNPLPLATARIQKTRDRGHERSKVKVAGGRGCEAATIGPKLIDQFEFELLWTLG
jgi:hypothetical protein